MKATFLNGKHIKIQLPVRLNHILSYLSNILMNQTHLEATLPWGHQIKIEQGPDDNEMSITFEVEELKEALEFLQINNKVPKKFIEEIKKNYELNFGSFERYNLYRQDDNSNIFIIDTYSTKRVASYYQQLFEKNKHKQIYWIEKI